jgi:hypothetical protein
VEVDALEAVWKEHRALAEVQAEPMIDRVAERCLLAGAVDAPDLAGVILDLGADARVAAVVPLHQAARLCAHHPFLASRLERLAEATHALPIVVWAAGHLSVQAVCAEAATHARSSASAETA